MFAIDFIKDVYKFKIVNCSVVKTSHFGACHILNNNEYL